MKETQRDVFQKLQKIGSLYEDEFPDKCIPELDRIFHSDQNPSIPSIGTRTYIKENAMRIIQNCLRMMEAWSKEEQEQGLQILIGCIDMIEGDVTKFTTEVVELLIKMSGTNVDPDHLKKVLISFNIFYSDKDNFLCNENWQICQPSSLFKWYSTEY